MLCGTVAVLIQCNSRSSIILNRIQLVAMLMKEVMMVMAVVVTMLGQVCTLMVVVVVMMVMVAVAIVVLEVSLCTCITCCSCHGGTSATSTWIHNLAGLLASYPNVLNAHP